jgi:hypothetical protein
MKKVRDLDGSIVRGAFKTETGAIVIKDDAALKIYQTRKGAANNARSELDAVRAQVAELQKLINQMQKG